MCPLKLLKVLYLKNPTLLEYQNVVDTAFPQDSAIYWNGPRISTTQIREGHIKKGKGKRDPEEKCVLVYKREC